MLFFNRPLTEAETDVIVIPCGLDGDIRPSSIQWKMMNRFGSGYEMEFLADIENDLMSIREPGMIKPKGENQPLLINLAIRDTNGNETTPDNILNNLREMIRFVSVSGVVKTIAIPYLETSFPEICIDNMLQCLDDLWKDTIEFHIYTDDRPEDPSDIFDPKEDEIPPSLLNNHESMVMVA